MPAHPIEKIPGEKYPLPLRDVPGDVMIEIERAAEEEGTSAQAVVRSVLRIWAKRREKSRHE